MQEFLRHVKEGLSKTPKKLSSRYFYDKAGDVLFQRIMKLEEYYLPRCEMEIIHAKSKQIALDIAKFHKSLQILELGAGDGTKTKHLLKRFIPHFDTIEYVAFDISPNVLALNQQEITDEVANIHHRMIPGNYFETYKNLPPTDHGRMVLFLGANIGNFSTDDSIDYFTFIKSNLSKNDFFMVAFDLVKHPRKILAAYDDKEKVTKEFNLNLLKRINKELGANFNLDQFDHFPFYNPLTGITSSQIISLQEQEVSLADGYTASFDAYEAIHTEISKKFFWSDIEQIAEQSGMQILGEYFDANREYAFILFQPSA